MEDCDRVTDRYAASRTQLRQLPFHWHAAGSQTEGRMCMGPAPAGLGPGDGGAAIGVGITSNRAQVGKLGLVYQRSILSVGDGRFQAGPGIKHRGSLRCGKSGETSRVSPDLGRGLPTAHWRLPGERRCAPGSAWCRGRSPKSMQGRRRGEKKRARRATCLKLLPHRDGRGTNTPGACRVGRSRRLVPYPERSPAGVELTRLSAGGGDQSIIAVATDADFCKPPERHAGHFQVVLIDSTPAFNADPTQPVGAVDIADQEAGARTDTSVSWQRGQGPRLRP